MFRSAGERRAVVVLLAALTLVAGSCSTRQDPIHKVVARKPPSSTTTVSSTTTSTTAGAVAAAAPRSVTRVRILPGDRPVRAAKPAKAAPAYRGPAPTGRILIPRIGLNHLTYEGVELSTIDYGPSHWPGTAMPGEVGNTVFPGHRVTHSHPFYNIDLIQIGDQVTFLNGSGRYTYEVTEHFVVDDEETWVANPTDTPTFTIFACHPKHSAQQRYVVKGKLVQAERATTSEPTPNDGRTAPGDNNSYGPPPQPATTTTTQQGSVIPRIGG
ncbi:MAG TPA: class E sortase [Acidimicrobiales bacterium]|nr:class E sortase [Acidimicrobiales bacterium]